MCHIQFVIEFGFFLKNNVICQNIVKNKMVPKQMSKNRVHDFAKSWTRSTSLNWSHVPGPWHLTGVMDPVHDSGTDGKLSSDVYHMAVTCNVDCQFCRLVTKLCTRYTTSFTCICILVRRAEKSCTRYTTFPL